MKQGRLFICLLLCALLVFGQAAGAENGDYVRLHVIAQSDSEEDQNLKLLVRDGVRAMSRKLLADCGSAEEAWETLNAHQAELWAAARVYAWLGGSTVPVAVELGTYEFPERQYGDLTLEAGEYRAVRVRLGEAQGGNWWCVLYPSLCVPVEGEIHFYSAFWRWLSGLWKEDAA